MCLSVVAQVKKIFDNNDALVELGNVRKTISLGLIADDVNVGDWVLIHTGFAISIIDEQKAREIIATYEAIDELIPF